MKNLIFYLFGRFTSLFGNSLLNIALPIYVLNTTSSASSLGAFLGILAIPAIFASPLLGNIIESKNKKYIMILTDFFSFFLYIFLFFMGNNPNFVILGTILFIARFTQEIFSLSSSSIFSHIVDKKYFEKGNSLKSILDNFAFLASPVIGVFIYNSWNIRTIFLINGITFGISAILECFIIYKHKIIELKTKDFFKNILEVKDFLLKSKITKRLFMAVMVLNFIVSPLSAILVPYLSLEVNEIGNSNLAITSSFYVAGSILGASLIFFKEKKFKLSLLLNLNSIVFVLIGVSSLLFVKTPTLFFMALSIFKLIIGCISSLINIPLISHFQKNIPQYMQARFFGILSFVSGCLIPLGNFTFGITTRFIPASISIIIGSITMIVITTLLLSKVEELSPVEES